MRFLFCLIPLVSGMSIARADPLSFYFGAGVTHNSLSNFGAQFNPELPSSYADISATSWKALAGVRPLPWLAVEGDFFGTAGNTSALGERSEAQALAGYAVLLTGQEAPLEAFFKAGISTYRMTASHPGLGTDTAQGVAAAVGLGLQAHYGHVGLRLEFEDLPGVGTSTHGLQVVSLSVLLNLP